MILDIYKFDVSSNSDLFASILLTNKLPILSINSKMNGILSFTVGKYHKGQNAYFPFFDSTYYRY